MKETLYVATLFGAMLLAGTWEWPLEAAPPHSVSPGGETATRLAARTAPGSRATPRPTARPTPRPTPRPTVYGGRRYEPARGIYLGASLDYSGVEAAPDRAPALAAVMAKFEGEMGRRQAIYSQFVPFPHPDGAFPTWEKDPHNWASSAEFSRASAARGAAPMLTLEPFQPQQFLDWSDNSAARRATEAYARAVGRWGQPVFIRFAHEMNGSWYPWCEWTDKNRNMQRDPGEETGFTPEHYRLVFARVAQAFRRLAPNAAMVWCPNSGLLGGARRDVFRPYYPGDAWVDWVGLDIYERGWTMPQPGSRLWGGSLGHSLTHDAADDPLTPDPVNESVDFYKIFAAGKRKPLMICETSATLSYRTDLSVDDREMLSHQWRAGYWNNHEHGWLQALFATSAEKAQPALRPLDAHFPWVKAIVWFQVAKRETIPVEKPLPDGGRERIWYENEWSDYRIGGGIQENQVGRFQQQEIELYRRLTANSYYLTRVVGPTRPSAPGRASAGR